MRYTITVDVEALNYKPFYMWDELTVLLDGKTYRVDAVLENMEVKITNADGTTTLQNLSVTNPNWIYDTKNNEDFPFPEGNYYAYFGKGVNGNWKNKGCYDFPFNPTYGGSWPENTSLNLQKESKIEITYDVNVDKEIGLYTEDNTFVENITLREYLIRNDKDGNDSAAILRNYIQVNAGGQWGGSKVDYSRGEKLRKTAVEQNDGTVDYTVTLLTDEAVKEALNKNIKQYNNWYTGLNIDFYDKFQDGWEYVKGSLTATPIMEHGRRPFIIWITLMKKVLIKDF